MKPIVAAILKYSALFALGTLVIFYVFWYFESQIPEFIPFTPIKTDGIFFGGYAIALLIAASKNILKINPSISVVNLTLCGTLIGFIAELVFQSIRAYSFTSDRLHYFVSGVILMTIAATIITFFAAFQLKTKKTAQLVLIILIFCVVYNLIVRFTVK